MKDEEMGKSIEWAEPNVYSCIVSDVITKENWKVGYMYREEPNNTSSDSGWRLFKGNETEEYNNNPENFHKYELNTICNYNPSIIPYIHSETGSAYIKVENEKFELDKGTQTISFKKKNFDNDFQIEIEIKDYKNEINHLEVERDRADALHSKSCEDAGLVQMRINQTKSEIIKKGYIFLSNDIISLDSSLDMRKIKIEKIIKNKANRIEIEKIDANNYIFLKNVPMMDGQYLYEGLLGMYATLRPEKIVFTISSKPTINMSTYPNSLGETYIEDKVLNMVNNKLVKMFGNNTSASVVGYRSKTWKFENYSITIGINKEFQFEMSFEKIKK